MNTFTISRIMAQNKSRFPVSKGDLAVYVVDIPKAAGLLNDLIQQELNKCNVLRLRADLEQRLNRVTEMKKADDLKHDEFIRLDAVEYTLENVLLTIDVLYPPVA